MIGSPVSCFAKRVLYIHDLVSTFNNSSNKNTQTETNPSFMSFVENLNCLMSHYMESIWIVEQHKLDVQVSSEAPMKEIQQLMNWYFEDMVNLQMNVEKLYRGLNRCLKLQEDAMSQDVKTVVLSQLQGKFRDKQTEHFINRIKSEGFEIKSQEDEELKQNKSKSITKTKLQEYILKLSNNTETSINHYKCWRHISMKKLLFTIQTGFHQDDHPVEESHKSILSEACKNHIKFKKYFNGKQCLKMYLQQNLQNIDRLKSAKRKFKSRYLLDFIKTFKSIFEVKKGVNLSNLTSLKVNY